jgi:hypothetical protein|tara:strand:+ start:97 stop:366 length:270 start_codon:yes stop_codon:yes gene_type:complete
LIYYNENGVFEKRDSGFEIKINKAKTRRNIPLREYTFEGVLFTTASMINNELRFYTYSLEQKDFTDNDTTFFDPDDYALKLYEYAPPIE